MKRKSLTQTTLIPALVSFLTVTMTSGQDAPSQVRYRVIDLGVDGTCNEILNSGRVVGSHNPGGDQRHGAFWPNVRSVPIDLGTLPGSTASRGFAINQQGQIVGIDIGTTVQSAVFWADSQSAPIELTGIDGDATASDINQAGLIVGTAIPSDGSGSFPVVWSSANAPATFLTEVSDQFPLGVALSVNAAGNILGDACTPDLSECHVAYWADSTSTPVALASPNDRFSITDIGASSEGTVAHSLNNRGNIVGFATTTNFSQFRAVYWESSSSPAVILKANQDFPNGTAEGINDEGQIVGACYTRDLSADHAFFWSSPNSPGIDLNTVIPANSGYEIVVARSINNRGEIAGGAYFDGGTVGHAVVLVPVH